MSLKPPKKSDIGKDWLSKRRNRFVPIHPEYHLIITEGTKTEPEYFQSVKDKINENFSDRIQLVVKGAGENTVSLIGYAKREVENSANTYKHVWIVYDTDDFPADKIDAVKTICDDLSIDGNCRYHAIWSNQCIELWYLLHFSYMHADIHRKEYFPKLSDCLGFKYEKNNPDMLEILLPYMDNAIRFAKQLDSDNVGKAPSQSKPGTKVYELVEMLKPYFSKNNPFNQ